MQVNWNTKRTADFPIGQYHVFTVTVRELERQRQAAEKVRQRRSRIVQILSVPQRVRLRSSLAAALLDGHFEQPAGSGILHHAALLPTHAVPYPRSAARPSDAFLHAGPSDQVWSTHMSRSRADVRPLPRA